MIAADSGQQSGHALTTEVGGDGATGQGLVGSEEGFARRLITPDTLPAWAESWETISAARAETLGLNLDRGLLVLNSWFGIQDLASRTTS